METNNEDKLKLQLRNLGFDSRIDENLHKNISYNSQYFNLKYEDQYNNNRIEYYIEFKKTAQTNTYKIGYYMAVLERNINIFHDTVNGVDTARLQSALSKFDWDRYTGRKALHAEVETFRNELTILSQSEQGEKIAQLLIARFWPLDIPVAERNEDLHFVHSKNVFLLRKRVTPEEKITAQMAYQFLKEEMDKLSDIKLVHSYAVVIELEMAKSGTPLMGRTKEIYDSLADAFTNMDNIDYRLFDKDFVVRNKLLCQIRSLNIIDELDSQIVVSKTVEAAAMENSNRQVAVTYTVNEVKITFEDFVRKVNLTANNSMKTQSMEDIRHLLSFFKPTLPRSLLNKSPDVKVKPPKRKGRRPGR
jgi:hypothetical protein